ncbi:MAG: hypothetical protein IPM29_31750 [Planctomycetes bacterium]|nr:hypothetical protein [Planctomycetota bacterium]
MAKKRRKQKKQVRGLPEDLLTERKVRTAPAEDPGRQPPSWNVQLLDHEGPFGWSHLKKRDVLGTILGKLSHFERMTWAEIQQGAGCHNVKLSHPKFASEAHRRLREIGQDDIDELFSLRLNGKSRVWGILFGSVLRILWWDPEHNVCPSGPNT